MSEKKKTKKINIFLAFVLVVVGTFLLYSSISIVYTRMSLNKQAEIVNEEFSHLQEENEELASIKSKLEDDNYVVTYARGEYMFSRGDEKLFKLPNKN